MCREFYSANDNAMAPFRQHTHELGQYGEINITNEGKIRAAVVLEHGVELNCFGLQVLLLREGQQ